MKTDLYTRLILTVIAIALTVIAVQNSGLVNTAVAGPKDFNNPFFNSVTVPLNKDGSINVNVVSDMDVNIHSIGGSSVYGSIPVNLKEVGGSSFYGAMPVNLKEMNGSSVSSNGIPVNIEAVDGMNVYSAVPVKEVK